MQVVPSGDQICNQCMWLHLVAKFGTNASGAILRTILQLLQIAPPGDQNWNKCKFLAGEITHVKEAIPWVRCASGNVFLLRASLIFTIGNLCQSSPILPNYKWVKLTQNKKKVTSLDLEPELVDGGNLVTYSFPPFL